jgi:membrane protein
VVVFNIAEGWSRDVTEAIAQAVARGAAIAFYTATSIAPILLIVIAIAGIVFGQEAAQNAITSQFSDLPPLAAALQ